MTLRSVDEHRQAILDDLEPMAAVPQPLLEAARRLGVMPQRCLYIGDDLRDVQAGRGAGMATLVAAWGYLGRGESIDSWNADAVLAHPEDLLNWLGMA